MSRRGSLGLLSIALVALLALFGTTAAEAGVGSAPAVGASPSPVPSPSPTISPSPTPNPCQPPPDATPPSDPGGASAVQDAIEDVAGRILALEDQNAYPGFTGLIGDPDQAQLWLCWLQADPLPAPVADIVANPGQPITVVRQDATYSRDFLDSRVSTILGNDSLGAQIGGNIHSVATPEEGTGLLATVLPDDPNVDPNQFIANAQPVLSSAAGVPVTVQIGPPETDATRRNDSSPWDGGARLRDAAGNRHCSSGFGLVRQRDNAQLLLTANHCFGAQAVFNGAGARIGTVTNFVPAGDSEAITIAAPGAAGRQVYVGGVNDATEGSVRITAVAGTVPNIFVCTSGSFSGEHCPLQVVRTRWRLRNGVGPVNLAVTTRASGPVAIAQGDSGGPVIYRGASAGQVFALGTIIGGTRTFNCVVYDGRVCFPDVIFNNLNMLMVNYGAGLP